MSLNPQTIVSKAIPTVIDAAASLGGVAAGVTAGVYVSSAINAAVPQGNFNLGSVQIGVGDVVTTLGGVAASIYAVKGGNALMKSFTKNFAYGLAGGALVNKAAQAAGYPAPFQSIIAPAPAAFARSRPLFDGRVIPSSAYASRAYNLNVA